PPPPRSAPVGAPAPNGAPPQAAPQTTINIGSKRWTSCPVFMLELPVPGWLYVDDAGRPVHRDVSGELYHPPPRLPLRRFLRPLHQSIDPENRARRHHRLGGNGEPDECVSNSIAPGIARAQPHGGAEDRRNGSEDGERRACGDGIGA